MTNRAIAGTMMKPCLMLLAAVTLAVMAGASAASPPAAAPAAPPATDALPELSALVVTNRGSFRFKLHSNEAPLTVANFCNLAAKGFFDGLPVHESTRVMRGTGLPSANFNPSWTFRREFNKRLRFDDAGCVAMRRLGEGGDATTHPTRWFVTIKEQPRWTLEHAIFGTVTHGMGVVHLLEIGDVIERVQIEGDAAPLLARHAQQIAVWDAALARSGWQPGQTWTPPPPLPPIAAPPAASPSAPPAPPAAPPSPAAPPAAPPSPDAPPSP